MYQETKQGSHIWEVKDLAEYKDGWYFSDETDQFNGPFDTQKIAEDNLDEYCKWLEGPTEVDFYEGTPKQKYDAGYLQIFGKTGKYD